MSWYDAMPGCGFTVRHTMRTDIERIVGEMTMESFVAHFDEAQSRGGATDEAVTLSHACVELLTISSGDAPIYVLGLLPYQGPAKGLLWGLPARDMPKHAAAIAHWFRRRYLPRMRQIGLLPIATAVHSDPKNRRWLEAAGAKEVGNMLTWEK